MAKFNFIKKIKKVRKKDQEEAALSGTSSFRYTGAGKSSFRDRRYRGTKACSKKDHRNHLGKGRRRCRCR